MAGWTASRSTPLPLIAVAEATGVSFISPATADVVASVEFDAPARGLAKVTGIDEPTLYVALGDDRVGLAIQRRRGDGKNRPRLDNDLRDARRRPTGALRRADRDGPRPGQRAGRLGRHDLRHRAPRATRSLPTRACRSAPRPGRSTPNGDHPSGDRQSILVVVGRRVAGNGRHRQPRLRLAPPRRHRRGTDGRPHLPARPDPLPETRDRGHRRASSSSSTGCSSSSADRDERRLRRAVHRRRLHPVRAALDGPLAQSMGVLGRAAR